MSAALLSALGGCLGLETGCTQSFRDASLDQQIAAFKETTSHLADLAERTDAAYSAELEYDGEDAEAYLKQSAGLRIPIRVRLGVFGNAKKDETAKEAEAITNESAQDEPVEGSGPGARGKESHDAMDRDESLRRNVHDGRALRLCRNDGGAAHGDRSTEYADFNECTAVQRCQARCVS
ncbi:MAG: hypothetical protein KJ057_12895 [Phycisphaerae bacterium]|nr:MAG: hypothetical protein EDS66_12975 [Planctomycetota bacterium]MCL4719361.1 hypothetical protein [Phycisphaerae bacterium]